MARNPRAQTKVRKNGGQGDQNKMARSLDNLAKFEEFEDEILPIMKKALKAGKSGPELFKLVESYAAARAISIGLTSEDEGKALSAVQDILNRVHGKAKESLDITTKYEQLSEDELDRRLKEKEEALSDDVQH